MMHVSYIIVDMKKETITIHTMFGTEKELTKEEVVGSYELESDGNTLRVVFLEDGIREFYLNGGKGIDAQWKIVYGEIHEEGNGGMNGIYRINKNGSITEIAVIGAQGWKTHHYAQV